MSLLQDFIRNAKSTDLDFDYSTISNIPHNLYCFDRWGAIVDCNESEAQTFGFSKPENLFGLTVFDVANEEMASIYYANNHQIINSEKSMISIEPVHFQEEKVNYLSYKVPLRSSQKIIGVIGLSIQVASHHHSYLKSNLTFKQEQCLYYLSQGMTMKEIARKFKVSARTIEHRIESIKNKLNCNNKSELIKKALQFYYTKNQKIPR